ncbi:hypothetical protein ABC347_12160 [Sphingomonas sp. 1P06PA]|uniref:hypothetical protein n=1 Tax=Sphingomonas sp. 1P06PA TaxID=554121 RepID=UPI0039A73435
MTATDQPRDSDHDEANRSPIPKVRPAHDASDDERLAADPSHEDAKLDIGLDETFPTSDPPANTRPGQSSEPPASSGYDEEAEKALQSTKD